MTFQRTLIAATVGLFSASIASAADSPLDLTVSTTGKVTVGSAIYKQSGYDKKLDTSLQLSTELLTIEDSGSQTGLIFSNNEQTTGIKKILVHTTGHKTGIEVGAENIHFNTIELSGNIDLDDPRIEVLSNCSTSIDTLIVSSHESVLQIDNSGTATVSRIQIADGARLKMQPEVINSTDNNIKAVYNIGVIDLGKNAIFATTLYKDSQQNVEYAGTPVFNLDEGATVDLSSALKGDKSQPDKATISAKNITVNVKNAAKADVYVPAQANRKDTTISVVGDGDNNTGNAAQDLAVLSKVVKETTKSEAGKVETSSAANVVVTQEASDIYDAATGVVSDDGTVTNVQTTANANTNGIAETTAVGLHIWRNEINDMNKRLGELRNSRADANGLWARVYNGKAKFGEQHVTNKYTAFQFGYDRQVFDGVWLGGAFSYTKGDSDFKQGDGDSHLFAFTGYGSWVAENGAFLDITAKVGRLKNGFDIRLDSGDLSSASYHTNAVSFSAEAGWRVAPFGNAFFIEPQAEIMAGHVYDATYETSTGLTVKQDAADALIGRAGLVVGLASAELGNCYVRASVLHDWEGDATFNYSKGSANRTITESLGGTWYEYGLGVNANVAKNVHVYADLEAADGGKVDTSYRFNLGVRYSF